MEVNPNHPVVQKLHDQWHTIVALLVHKYGYAIGGTIGGPQDTELLITQDDINSFRRDGAIIVVEDEFGIHLKLINKDIAMRMARKEGGLPT